MNIIYDILLLTDSILLTEGLNLLNPALKL